MTRRAGLQTQFHSLSEIREIMNSMKTLAYMETRKLDQFIAAQQQVVRSINQAATEFIHCYPEILASDMEAFSVLLLIGSERGFCGDFNHAVYREFKQLSASHPPKKIIVVGRKLHLLMLEQQAAEEYLEGPSVVEDVPESLIQIVNILTAIQAEQGAIRLTVISHTEQADITQEQLLPAFQTQKQQPANSQTPPLLNLTPQAFFLGISEHYLFSSLHDKLYSSLLAENHRRVAHLEGAIQHLNNKSEQLARKLNTLRQEEIIEEIEVILLSAVSLEPRQSGAEH